MISRWVGAALLAMMMGSLAGCGGGGGGGGGGTSTPVSVAAGGATITGITVNSPPVLTFVVNDSAGKPVTGLTLYKAGYDGHCGSPEGKGNYTANAEFAIAKFDGANWQSLISRQRYAVDDLSDPTAPKHAVIEGTTDPVPAPGYTNPDTAVTDPSSRIVGILEEANGVYTYRFAMDVTTPLLMAAAVDKKNVSLGKVANNGNLAIKDGKTLHRVVLQLCFVDPVTQATVKLNPYLDFTLGADGKGIPNMDSQGNPTPARKVVDRNSCNDCHVNFAQHDGNRVDPNFCVVCHNPGSTDFETGNPIDFKLMVHKLHMGKRLTQDYAVGSAVARQDRGGGVIAGVLYPQDQRNCVKCHDGSATAVHRTPQGDNWINKPSKNACFACHDDYKNPGSKWQTYHAGYAHFFFPPGLSNPDNTPDSVCQQCHNSAGVSPAKSHEIPEWVASGNYQYHIGNISRNDNNTLSVEYWVSNPKTGDVYDLLDPPLASRFGSLAILFGWNSTDYANDGGPGRGQPFSTKAATDASVQRVGTGNHFTLTSSALPASGTVAVAFQGRVDEPGLRVPVQNVVKYFAMSGVVRDRRQVVSADKCNACHGRFIGYSSLTSPFMPGVGAHDANSNDPQVCVICHNGNNPLDGTIVSGGVVTQYAESADFKRMIHRVHAAQAENYPVWPNVKVTTHLHSEIYSGLKNCEVCHVNGSYKQNLSVVGTSVTFDVDAGGNVIDTDASNNLVISPKASTCSSCHDSDDAKNHMVQTGGAAFGTVTQGNLAAGQVFESCDGCHQPGGEKPVDIVHLGVQQ